MLRDPSDEDGMAEAATTATTGGPAAGIRWDLSHLYAGPDDPQIEKDLAGALAAANEFAARHRGRVASLGAAELARSVDELEVLQEPVARAGAFAGLLFAADTQTPRHGALLQHVQERGTEIRNALLFFELEWLATDPARAQTVLADPALARRRHFLTAIRRYREHVLSEPEERVLAETHNTGSAAWSRLFDQIMADLVFEVSVGGERRRLSEEETLALLYDPTARRAAPRRPVSRRVCARTRACSASSSTSSSRTRRSTTAAAATRTRWRRAISPTRRSARASMRCSTRASRATTWSRATTG
jgi:oligoendopeptidase F